MRPADLSLLCLLSLTLLLPGCVDRGGADDDDAADDDDSATDDDDATGDDDDATGDDDDATGDDDDDLETIFCRLVHVVPDDGQTRIRIWPAATGEGVVVLTEADEMIDGTLARTVSLTPSPAGAFENDVFGFDGVSLSEETDWCDDLPPVEPAYFDIRGTVDGAPAEGRCGFGAGAGGWPPEVRVACGGPPIADSAVYSVYADPFAPKPGATEVTIMFRLEGPASGVQINAEEVVGSDMFGGASTLTVGTDFEVFSMQADSISFGTEFDGEVPAEGRDVFLSLYGGLSLGPEFCGDSVDGMEPPPSLYVRGTATGSTGSTDWTTSAFSCVNQSPDQDQALP